MPSQRVRVLAAAAALAVALAGCGTAPKPAADPGSGQVVAPGAPIKIGVVTSVSGNSQAAYATAENGIKARLHLANTAGGIGGHRIEYVLADDASTPQGALAAVQKLVEQDQVFGVISVSAFFYGATNYLKGKNVPVVGGGFDGPEWGDPMNTNFFSAVTSTTAKAPTATTIGDFLKKRGVTRFGTVAYKVPNSTTAAKSVAKSAEVAGIPTGYINTDFPFGSADVGAPVLALKDAGVDGAYFPTVTSTSFAILIGLKQNGITLKAAVLPTGYGAELLKSASAVAAAQGAYFLVPMTPMELDTAATRQFQAALTAVSGSTGIPSYAEYQAYIATGAFIKGLVAGGQALSQGSFMTGLRAVKDWDGDGLFPVYKRDFTKVGQEQAGLGPNNCTYVVQVQGTSFVPVVGADPICGTLIPGADQG